MYRTPRISSQKPEGRTATCTYNGTMPPRGLTPLAEAIYAKEDVAPLITDESKDEADAVRVPHR